MEINREFIHCFYQLDRQHCFAVYLRIPFHLLENVCRRFPAIAEIELSKTFKTIRGFYTDQRIKDVSLHTKKPNNENASFSGNDHPEISSAFFLKIFHPAEFFSVLSKCLCVHGETF